MLKGFLTDNIWRRVFNGALILNNNRDFHGNQSICSGAKRLSEWFDNLRGPAHAYDLTALSIIDELLLTQVEGIRMPGSILY